jgi:hypothetical protein
MKDREFIELLNLYVDHEISAEDALRLEAEVASQPARREIYDQYCRMQKACSMLSEELIESAAGQANPSVVAFPHRRRWAFGPLAVGMAAAAACAVAVIGLRNRGVDLAGAAPSAAVGPAKASPVAQPPALLAATDSMRPVFFAHRRADQVSQGADPALDLTADPSAQVAELNWIGDIHLAPVFPTANADFLLNTKSDPKAQAATDTQDNRENQEPAEMAAFRFQR